MTRALAGNYPAKENAVILDPGGAVVAKAIVAATNSATQEAGVASLREGGMYLIVNREPGTCSVRPPIHTHLRIEGRLLSAAMPHHGFPRASTSGPSNEGDTQ